MARRPIKRYTVIVAEGSAHAAVCVDADTPLPLESAYAEEIAALRASGAVVGQASRLQGPGDWRLMRRLMLAALRQMRMFEVDICLAAVDAADESVWTSHRFERLDWPTKAWDGACGAAVGVLALDLRDTRHWPEWAKALK